MVGGPKDGDADAAVDPNTCVGEGLLPFSAEAFGDSFENTISMSTDEIISGNHKGAECSAGGCLRSDVGAWHHWLWWLP